MWCDGLQGADRPNWLPRPHVAAAAHAAALPAAWSTRYTGGQHGGAPHFDHHLNPATSHPASPGARSSSPAKWPASRWAAWCSCSCWQRRRPRSIALRPAWCRRRRVSGGGQRLALPLGAVTDPAAGPGSPIRGLPCMDSGRDPQPRRRGRPRAGQPAAGPPPAACSPPPPLLPARPLLRSQQGLWRFRGGGA